MNTQPRHKKIRLPLEAYAEPGSTWHVTMCTIDRVPAFRDLELAADTCAQVQGYGERYRTILHAWCLMPDHLHMIAQGTDQSLLKMLGAFKSFTTKRSWNYGRSGPLWQESFYDHGIRQVEDFDETVRYLLDNPTRASLVAEASEYPWRGGAVLSGYEP